MLGESPWFRLKYARLCFVCVSVEITFSLFQTYAVFLAYHIFRADRQTVTYLRLEPKQELLRVADINTWGLNFGC